jgi:disulfide bond formation protein DsbB
VAFFYFQQHLGLSPCPWCIVQRAVFILAGLHALVLANIKKVAPSKLWPLQFWVGLGLAVSAYHAWLQHQPDESVVCMDGWSFNRGLVSGLSQLWTPTGSCTDVGWTLWLALGVMAAWMGSKRKNNV